MERSLECSWKKQCYCKLRCKTNFSIFWLTIKHVSKILTLLYAEQFPQRIGLWLIHCSHSEPRWHKASEPHTWNMVTRLKFYNWKTITESIFFLHLLLLHQCKICKVILSAQRSSCLIPQSFLQKFWGTCCQLFVIKYLRFGLWNIFICWFLRGNKISWRRGGRVGGYNQAFQILKINIFIAVSLS